jgi:hypothetical protein
VLSPIVVDPPAGMSLVTTTANSSAKVPAAAAVRAAGTVAGALESEQQLLAQLVHHVSLADTDVAYQVCTTKFASTFISYTINDFYQPVLLQPAACSSQLIIASVAVAVAAALHLVG